MGKYIGDSFIFIAKQLKTLTEHSFSDYHLGQGQISLLLFLFLEKNLPISQNSIAKKMELNKANVSRNVTKLIEKKLLGISHNPEDSREQLIYLTDDAYGLKSIIISQFQSINSKMLEGISQDEVELLKQLLQKVEQNLGGLK